MYTRCLLLLLVAVGCGNSTGVSSSPRVSVPRPTGLIAMVEIGNDEAHRGLRAFVEDIKPGSQAELSAASMTPKFAQVVGAASLDGLDATSPRFAVWFDDGIDDGVAFIGKFKDSKALTKNLGQATAAFQGDWAVVGKPAVVTKVKGYALEVFPRLPSVSTPTATLDVPQLLRRYRKEIDAAHKQYVALASTMPNTAQMSAMLDIYFSGLLSMLEDSDQAVMTISADKQLGSVDISLVPRSNTRFATFVSLQKPAALALLERLPALPTMMTAAGRFDGGPYRQGLLDMMATFYPQTEGNAMVTLLRELMATSTGDFAFSGTFSLGKGMEFLAVFPMSDATAPVAAVDKFIAWLGKSRTLTQMGVKTTMVPAKPATISGVAVRGYNTTLDFSTVPEPQREMTKMMMPTGMVNRIAMVDKLAVVAMSTNPTVTLTQGIAAASGKTAGLVPSGGVARLLATARTHNDSLAFVVDVGSMVGKSSMPFMMSLGFEKVRAHMRMVVPSSSIKAVAP